ncbi:hypothetical protein [Actinomyces sp. MRS3W]|uniref:hypothetical protein n=1 Tax=Actinomyces sp. MRS3W TaxID=2800796 RepID=UPI0028FD2782|nr:hypothetical protein [Actinomyces sp. MRS3W]MDU0348085.1 hypothetical protein [Actinomyces sp. MRS3W]
MQRLPRIATYTATTLTAAALALTMSACNSGSSDGEAVSTDQEVTVEESTASGSDESADTGSDTDATTEAEPTVPDGYTLTEVPDAELSFAVPSDWTTLTGEDVSNTELVDAVASTLGRSTDEVAAMFQGLALYSVDTSGTSDFAENLNVEIVDNVSTLPAESDLVQLLERQSDASSGMVFEPGTYTETTTASGQGAAVETYTLPSDGGTTVQGSYVVVPAKNGSAMALIAISTTSAERTQELADAILGSI